MFSGWEKDYRVITLTPCLVMNKYATREALVTSGGKSKSRDYPI